MGARNDRADGRSEVLRPARHLAAHDAADQRLRRIRVRRRARFRRLVDPRLAGHLRVGHAPDAGRLVGDPRSVHRGSDALAPLRDRRPDHARAATREIRVASRSAPRSTSARRASPTRPTWARVRVLRLRRGVVRARPESRALPRRLRRGPLELRQARARLHGSREGGLLPACAARHAARPAHADGADARAARDPVRVSPPRGRVRRSVRDRPPLPAADADGRSGHDLQVRRQERRPCRGQVGDVHAEAASSATTAPACTRTSRCGRKARR